MQRPTTITTCAVRDRAPAALGLLRLARGRARRSRTTASSRSAPADHGLAVVSTTTATTTMPPDTAPTTTGDPATTAATAPEPTDDRRRRRSDDRRGRPGRRLSGRGPRRGRRPRQPARLAVRCGHDRRRDADHVGLVDAGPRHLSGVRQGPQGVVHVRRPLQHDDPLRRVHPRASGPGARSPSTPCRRCTTASFVQPLASVGDLGERGESSGCIRVLPDDAVRVWDWLAIGDEVHVIS